MLHACLFVRLGENGLMASPTLSLAELVPAKTLKCPEGESSFCLWHMFIDVLIGGIFVLLVLVDCVVDLPGQLAVLEYFARAPLFLLTLGGS